MRIRWILLGLIASAVGTAQAVRLGYELTEEEIGIVEGG
jgi:hypothetical protein